MLQHHPGSTPSRTVQVVCVLFQCGGQCNLFIAQCQHDAGHLLLAAALLAVFTASTYTGMVYCEPVWHAAIMLQAFLPAFVALLARVCLWRIAFACRETLHVVPTNLCQQDAQTHISGAEATRLGAVHC